MRRLLLVALLAGGCDVGEGFSTHELPTSRQAPIEAPAGTWVVQTWQFRNPCPFVAGVFIWKGDLETSKTTVQPGETLYLDPRCAVGEEMCFHATRVGPPTKWTGQRECIPCTPGVLPVRELACE